MEEAPVGAGAGRGVPVGCAKVDAVGLVGAGCCAGVGEGNAAGRYCIGYWRVSGG